MKKIGIVLLFFTLPYGAKGQVSEFSQPWLDSTRALLIDPYHANPVDWEQLATDSRVVAVLHKATQGYRVDRAYASRRDTARARGYKWGAYHLGMPGDPVKQADFFLETTGIQADEVYALDLEGLDARKYMPLDSAVKFIGRVFEKTGRYPLVYCNRVVLNGIAEKFDSSSVFARCPLWYARFRDDIPDFNTSVWPTYTIWQFSCELNCRDKGSCPYRVPGTKSDMDVNVYNGTIEDLLMAWPDLRPAGP